MYEMTRATLDPYTTLGIPRGASQRQVRQAYRQLARRHHPDLHPDGEANARMQRVNQAWEILSSPERRASYDAASAARGAASAGHWAASGRAGAAWSRSTAWQGTWSSPPPAAGWHGTGTSQTDDADGPTWRGIVLAIALGMVAFVAMFAGILPFPIAGFALLVLLRGAFGRFDERGR